MIVTVNGVQQKLKGYIFGRNDELQSGVFIHAKSFASVEEFEEVVLGSLVEVEIERAPQGVRSSRSTLVQ